MATLKPLFCLFFFSVANALQAQSTSLQSVVDYYTKEKNFSGVVLVAKNNQIEYLKGTGFADLRSGITINSKTRFRIASITKTFTAALVMQLVAEGKLNLDEKIAKYLPEYGGEAKDKTSLYNLLTYSSGIPNCEKIYGDTVYKTPVSVENFITRYCSGKLESIPGSTFNYDNGDYIIIGRILEKITGKTFKDLLQTRILEPLKMKNTGMLSSADIVTGMADSYIYDDSTKSFSNDPPYYIENFFSSGAMYSTAEDLLLFDQAIFENKLFSKAILKTMLTSNAKLGNVALGFWEAAKYGSIDSRFYYRPGGIYGATANWIHVLDSSRTFIVLSNTSATNLFDFSQQLYLAETGKVPSVPAVSARQNPVPTDRIAAAAGKWIIDLRPGPKSESYLKDFILNPGSGNGFSGEFYGSPFLDGQFNTSWEDLYFAFTTSDQSNVYYHSGHISGNSISGVSFSANRKFVSHWTGFKK